MPSRLKEKLAQLELETSSQKSSGAHEPGELEQVKKDRDRLTLEVSP